MLLCIVYAMLFVYSVDIYREKLLKHLGVPPYLVACGICSMYQQCQHTLAKVAFSHTSFWQESFLNISNHLPDSSFA